MPSIGRRVVPSHRITNPGYGDKGKGNSATTVAVVALLFVLGSGQRP